MTSSPKSKKEKVQHHELHSMTGFGRAEGELAGKQIHVELKSVNHRFCDIRIRLPNDLHSFEPPLRQQIQKYVSRGRVEVSIFFAKGQENLIQPHIDFELVSKYQDLYGQLAKQLGDEKAKVDLHTIIHLPGVLLTQSQSNEEMKVEELQPILQEALDQFIDMRRAEGLNTKSDLQDHLSTLEQHLAEIAKRAPLLPDLQFERLQTRLQQHEWGQSIAPDRLHQEVAMWSDRCDVSEELNRAASHNKQFQELLEKGGVTGRRLDFLCQELHREANTIGSKNQDAQISSVLIELKAEIEKLREQVQNIE